MFTYPIFGGGGSGDAFLGEEWVVFFTGSGNLIKYAKVNHAAQTYTELDSFAMPYSSAQSVATDGTFLFVTSGVSGALAQYAWNGTDFTSRHNAGTGASNTHNGVFFVPGNAGRLIATGGEDFSHGLRVFTYQSAPTYAWGAGTVYTPTNDNWNTLIDFRVGVEGEPVYGDTLVAFGGAGGDLRSMTFSGNTTTGHSSLANAGAGAHNVGWDRDSGVIASITGSNSSIYLYQLDMVTRALSSIGTGTATGTVFAVAISKDVIVTLEDGGASDYIRSYTRSGATLSQVGEIAVGAGQNSNAWAQTSPYSGRVYILQAQASSNCSRVLDVAADGAITTVVTLNNYACNTGDGSPIAFLSAAAPTI